MTEPEFERLEHESLREHLYVLGRKLTPAATIERVTGGWMDARPYVLHLREKLAARPA